MITVVQPQHSRIHPTLSRRRFLSGMAAAGAAAAGMSACQVQTGGEETGGGGGAGGGTFEMPDPVGDLPDGDVTIRWMSGGPGAKTAVFETLFPAYEEKHPNLTVTYNELTNEKIGEVLPVQLRNGNADDVFQVLQAQVPLSQLVAAGQVAALDDVIPDFEAWKSAMPDNVIVPGIDEFDGKTYQFRTSTDRLLPRLLLFNREIMEHAGYDPVNEPLTLDTFREAARTMTDQGGGEVFGLMTPGGDPTAFVEIAGGPPNIDWQTGLYAYSDDMYVEVIEWLKAMVDDGTVFPGWATQNDQQLRGQFPLGRAGMLLNGPWNFTTYNNDFPDFDYGVAAPPGPADHGYRHFTSAGGNGYAVYADSPDDHKLVAGDLLHFFGTEEGQKFWARHDGAADPAWSESAIAELRESDELSEQDDVAFRLYDEYVREQPDPVIGNPDAETVRLLLKPVQPRLPQLVAGYLTGEIDDIRQALQQLNDASNQALDDAIAEARAQGAEVSREDWVYSNWDPSRDYTTDDYENR